MHFEAYQNLARKTAVYPDQGKNIYYPTLGLVGEAGEIANKVKKIMRDDNGIVSPDKREDLKSEIGDVLWYIAALCQELHIDMVDCAQGNIEKLYSRMERGVLCGSGDNR